MAAMIYSQMSRNIAMFPRTIVSTLCYALSLGKNIEAFLSLFADFAYIICWMYWWAISCGVVGWFRSNKTNWMNRMTEKDILEHRNKNKCAEVGLYWGWVLTGLYVVMTTLLIIHLPSSFILVDASWLLIALVILVSIVLNFKFKQQVLECIRDLGMFLHLSVFEFPRRWKDGKMPVRFSMKLKFLTPTNLIAILRSLAIVVYNLKILNLSSILLNISLMVITGKWSFDCTWTWAIRLVVFLVVFLALKCTYDLVLQVLSNVGIISSHGGRHKNWRSCFSDLVRLPSYVRNMIICLVCLTVFFQIVGLPLGNHFALVEGILVVVCWSRVIMVELGLCESKFYSALLPLLVSFLLY